MHHQYILGGPDGHTPIPEPDSVKWGRWFQQANQDGVRGRRVAKTTIWPVEGDRARYVEVSTVFLGLDHGYWGVPLLFETMVFPSAEYAGLDMPNGEGLREYCERYATWAEAEAGHKRIVEMVHAALGMTLPESPDDGGGASVRREKERGG